jgi:hypothetical protein
VCMSVGLGQSQRVLHILRSNKDCKYLLDAGVYK